MEPPVPFNSRRAGPEEKAEIYQDRSVSLGRTVQHKSTRSSEQPTARSHGPRPSGDARRRLRGSSFPRSLASAAARQNWDPTGPHGRSGQPSLALRGSPEIMCVDLAQYSGCVEPSLFPRDQAVKQIEDMQHAETDRRAVALHAKKLALDVTGGERFIYYM